jgi:serine phosphatase RsbU (regulator of sigma subunit)
MHREHMYGYESVARLYNEVAAMKPEEMIQQFQKVLQSWSENLPQQDDVTILVMKMKARDSTEYRSGKSMR